LSYLVFDTETTSLDKPFCYDIGYKIISEEKEEVRRHFVVEQVWHNLPLFESAYYKEKRPLYIQLMRAKKAMMDKWGYIMRTMARDIKQYNVTDAYAYNSDFDDKVLSFNCDWFKCINPLETVPIHDIWGYASEFITGRVDYKLFCETHNFFTDTGNYKSSAEVVYRFITDNPDFIEAHMGAFDGDIEAAILKWCFENGATPGTDYKVVKILPRFKTHPYEIRINGAVVYKGQYIKKYIRDGVYSFTEQGH
jgi:hypothetical protein